MINTIQTGMKAVAGLIMRSLVATGVVVEHSIFVENWRRPNGCRCVGCRNWRRIERGYSKVEQFCEEQLRCRHRLLAWRDSVATDRRWNPKMVCLWFAVVALCFVNMYTSIGVIAIVTTVGKNDLLTQYFKGSAYTAAWFVGLVDGGSSPTYAAADTMASHSGWTENAGYSNATRITWTGGTASGGSIDNSASAATFNMNATGSIAGLFMVSNSTKSGSTGTLYSEGNFTQGTRSVLSGDTLVCTATETAS